MSRALLSYSLILIGFGNLTETTVRSQELAAPRLRADPADRHPCFALHRLGHSLAVDSSAEIVVHDVNQRNIVDGIECCDLNACK